MMTTPISPRDLLAPELRWPRTPSSETRWTTWRRRRQLRQQLVCVRLTESELVGVVEDIGPGWIALIQARLIGSLFEGDQVVTSQPFSILVPTAAIRMMQVLSASAPPSAAG